jgi:acyl dehydratase
MGRYFEEFQVGEKFTTEPRTVTEKDIMTFADLTGDNNRIHTDAEFSKAGPFGQRIAHGLLGLSFVMGLAWRTGFLDGTVLAFREINEWKFIKPVFIGDTIRAELNVIEARALPRIGGGSVVLQAELRNKQDAVCMRGKLSVLVMSRPK